MTATPLLPARCADLAMFKSLPVPWFTYVRDDGTPDFRVTDLAKLRRCAQEQLCGICGQVLEYWMVFIGGPLSCRNRVFADPPMHEECARFAATVCPFLRGETDYVPEEIIRRRNQGAEIWDDPHVWTGPTTELAFYLTRSYSTFASPGRDTGQFYWLAAPAKRIEWFARTRPPMTTGGDTMTLLTRKEILERLGHAQRELAGAESAFRHGRLWTYRKKARAAAHLLLPIVLEIETQEMQIQQEPEGESGR